MSHLYIIHFVIAKKSPPGQTSIGSMLISISRGDSHNLPPVARFDDCTVVQSREYVGDLEENGIRS